mgnify:FL=1
MEIIQDIELLPKRRNQILDLLINTLPIYGCICITLRNITDDFLITLEEKDLIEKELSKYFLSRHDEGN